MKETMTLPKLTEATIRAGATAQSLERGRDYYRGGALRSMAIQGQTLMGVCSGRSAPAYHVQVALGEHGVESASCTCPYEWDGWCKHIVALLLAYVHEPERFAVRQTPAELLAGLDREALTRLLERLVAERPQLYDWLAAAVAAPEPVELAPGRPADPALFRREVDSIVYALDDRYGYDGYGMAGDLVGRLQDVEAAALDYLEAGDPRSALEVLLAIMEGVAAALDAVDDSEGELGWYLNKLGGPLAEAVLSLEPGGAEREALALRLRRVGEALGEYAADDGVGLALVALRQGWRTPARADDDLTTARLNVLARQGRMEEYLELCRQAGEHRRYALALCDLDRAGEAVAYAAAHLEEAQDALAVAQRLQELGHTAEALELGERGLTLAAPRQPLAEWLAPLAEAQGRLGLALEARLLVLAERPALAAYREVKQLAGAAWPAVQPRAMASLEAKGDKTALAEVLLLEEQWDAAIALAEGERYGDRVKAIVADGVASVRPEWVAKMGVAQAEALLVEANATHYVDAAAWLRSARDAYAATGRGEEWGAYLQGLKLRYKRRPALQRELQGL